MYTVHCTVFTAGIQDLDAQEVPEASNGPKRVPRILKRDPTPVVSFFPEGPPEIPRVSPWLPQWVPSVPWEETSSYILSCMTFFSTYYWCITKCLKRSNHLFCKANASILFLHCPFCTLPKSLEVERVSVWSEAFSCYNSLSNLSSTNNRFLDFFNEINIFLFRINSKL